MNKLPQWGCTEIESVTQAKRRVERLSVYPLGANAPPKGAVTALILLDILVLSDTIKIMLNFLDGVYKNRIFIT